MQEEAAHGEGMSVPDETEGIKGNDSQMIGDPPKAILWQNKELECGLETLWIVEKDGERLKALLDT